MMIMKSILPWMAAIAMTGCAGPQPHPAQLPIARLEYSDRTEIKHLPSDYGFLVRWPDRQSPELFVVDKPANRMFLTDDFDTFLHHLQDIPPCVKVDQIRECGITGAGMPEAFRQRLQQVLETGTYSLTDEADGNFTICVCETTRVTWINPGN